MSGKVMLQVNTNGAWKNLAPFPMSLTAEVETAVKRLAAVLPGAKWCTVDKAGKRRRIEVGEQQAVGMRTAMLALEIADDSVRSDVECYAVGSMHPDGYPVYDVSRAAGDPEDEAEGLRTIERAVSYIDLRGGAVRGWRMLRQIDAPNLVRFEEVG